MFVIRPETPADAAAIRNLHLAAFPTEAEAGLVAALRAAGQSTIALTACLDDQLCGHVVLSPVSLQGVCRADGGLGLAPVAVMPRMQNRGIGSWLLVAAIAAARRAQARYLVVLGDPAWYQRFGFEPAARYGLDSEYDAGDAFQVLSLRSGALPPEGGLIRYAPAFGALSEAEQN